MEILTWLCGAVVTLKMMFGNVFANPKNNRYGLYALYSLGVLSLRLKCLIILTQITK